MCVVNTLSMEARLKAMVAKNMQAPTIDMKRLAKLLVKSQKVQSFDIAEKSKSHVRPVRINLSFAPPPGPSDKGSGALKKESSRKKSTAGRSNHRTSIPSPSPSPRGSRGSDITDAI